VTRVRVDPDALRGPSDLVPEGQLVSFLDRRGDGLAGVYYSILARGDDSFRAIAEDLRRLFPTVRGLRVPAVSQGQVTIEVELTDGTRVRPQDLSEGLLLYLAFAAIPHLQAVRTVLIEEPETGLHPARIREVLTLLRSFAVKSGTQVLMATHSPLVVNELEPHEVIVLTRTPAEGTRATVLKDTPRFEERSKIFALGELWLSYADGMQEQPLLAGKAP
jgi:predicted ATPase